MDGSPCFSPDRKAVSRAFGELASSMLPFRRVFMPRRCGRPNGHRVAGQPIEQCCCSTAQQDARQPTAPVIIKAETIATRHTKNYESRVSPGCRGRRSIMLCSAGSKASASPRVLEVIGRDAEQRVISFPWAALCL